MKHRDDESDSEEEFVQKVLPAFTRSQVSPGFRESVLARIEEASVSPRRDFRWGIPTWTQGWAPALTVGLAVVALMMWSPLPPRERSPEPDPSGTRGNAPAQEVEESFYKLVDKGIQEAKEGDTEEAKKTLLKAIQQVAAPLNALAWIDYKQGDPASGLSRAQLAVQLFPENPNYQDTLATILCMLDRREEAVEAMELAVRLQPEKYRDKLVRFRRGVCQ